MFLLYRYFSDMSRVCSLFLLLIFSCSELLANIGVELDVSFRDSTVQCRYLYVLSPNTGGTNDTLAVFDSLSFNGQNRVSLFYAASPAEDNMLLMADSSGMQIESKLFRVSHRRTTFDVIVGKQQIKVTNKDYLYPQKNEDERSYFIFLTIFLVVKILITAIFVFTTEHPKRIVSIASGAFLLSAFVDWFFPLHYLCRFLITMVVEYLLIAFVGHRSISWLWSALLVLLVNVIGFGFITVLYLLYVFW